MPDRRSVPESPVGSKRRRALALWSVALIALACGLGVLVWSMSYPRGPLFDPVAALPEPLPSDRAELHARRFYVAFDDNQAFWRGAFPSTYEPARVVLFTRGTISPCADGEVTAGPFYCDGTVAFDLLFADALARRMQREAELGNFLVVARLAAEHVLAELTGSTGGAGSTALADCLTGVWARARAPMIGEVAPETYGRVIQTASNAATDLAQPGPALAPVLDIFGRGRRAHRDAAFQTGYAMPGAVDCLALDLPGADD